MDRPRSVAITRAEALQQTAQRLRRENQLLRETLRRIRQQLREERAKARQVSHALNPRLKKNR